jgi:hypothetical protein
VEEMMSSGINTSIIRTDYHECDRFATSALGLLRTPLIRRYVREPLRQRSSHAGARLPGPASARLLRGRCSSPDAMRLQPDSEFFHLLCRQLFVRAFNLCNSIHYVKSNVARPLASNRERGFARIVQE